MATVVVVEATLFVVVDLGVVVVVALGTVVVVDVVLVVVVVLVEVVVVVGNTTFVGADRMAPGRDSTSGNEPANDGYDFKMAAMASCQISAGIEPPSMLA